MPKRPSKLPTFKMPMSLPEQSQFMNRFMRRQADQGETGPGAMSEEQRLKDMLEKMDEETKTKVKGSGKSNK